MSKEVKKPRTKIDIDVKAKARELFEAGYDMVVISTELQLNLQSLYNISSREKWKKGILEELIYLEEKNLVITEQSKENFKVKTSLRSRVKGILKDLKSLEKVSDEDYEDSEDRKSLALTKATAIKLRAGALKDVTEVARKVFFLPSEEEKEKMQLSQLKYIELKKKLGIDKDESNKDEGDILIG